MDSKLQAILRQVSRPSQYLGNELNVIKKDFDQAEVRVALIFPDKYELGMSHVGLRILYDILNKLPFVVCERAFAPDLDMEGCLRHENLPLFSLESKRPLKDFDILGFSFTYELTYSNFLNILDLAQIPRWQKDRNATHPIILGGGGCMTNAEPIADFLDASAIGDGEELVLDVVDTIRQWKKQTADRATLLDHLSNIEGIYIPSFFTPEYNPDGTLKKMLPLKSGYEKIKKRIVANIDQAPYPTNLLVPSVKLVHDRIGIEIQRGCNRACRFCQAGYIDRPVRQRSPTTILNIAEESRQKTGIGEISLLSLSAADYECLVPLLKELNGRYAGERVAISVPATRTEKLGPELIEQIKKVRKTGFTIAPEAGSARMRRVINKGNAVDDLYRAVTNAFSAGWNLLKLYYMVGLPFEHDEDVAGIAFEANESIKICLGYSNRAELKLGLSSFVPKPQTPFQWEPQMTIAETERRYSLVKKNLQNRRIRANHHNAQMSFVEGLFSRGDRRLAPLLAMAVDHGCRFDEWQEHFDFGKWESVFAKWDGDPAFYLHRQRGRDETLPWDHLFAQMDKNFLWDEFEKSRVAGGEPEEQVPAWRRLKPKLDQLPGFTEDCSVERCSDCGVCDYQKIKNRVYVPGDASVVVKKGHREWYGGTAGLPSTVDSRPLPENQKITGFCKLRFRYTKTGPAVYMGHLELMDVLRRAIHRVKLPVAYSQGFHPQMKLAMSHALPVGIDSEWEYFDLEFTSPVDPGQAQNQLNQALPAGLRVLEIQSIDSRTPSLYSNVRSLEYMATMPWPQKISKMLADFKNGADVVWIRKNARGEKKFNLQDAVEVNHQPDGCVFNFHTKIEPSGTLKPSEVLEALLGIGKEKLNQVYFKKTGIQWKEVETRV